MPRFVRIKSALRDIVAIEGIRWRHLVVVTDHAISLKGIRDHLFAWDAVFQGLPEIVVTGWIAVGHHGEVGVPSRCRSNNLHPRSALHKVNQVSIYFRRNVILTRHHGVHASSAVDVGDPLQSVEIAITPVIGVSLDACVDTHLVFFHYEAAGS